MKEEVCYSGCPFFRYKLQEGVGLPDILLVFCQFFKNGKEPMLSVSDGNQIAFVLAQLEEHVVVFDDVDCIAPQTWKKKE